MLSVAKERKAIVDFRNIIEQKELENISSVKQIPYLAGCTVSLMLLGVPSWSLFAHYIQVITGRM
jgi:hypothetical protein